jgi:probable phosphoglycerate mutase
MTRFWIIRHGAHDWIGKSLVGRAAGIPLNTKGRQEAKVVASALAHVRLSAIYSSPMQRATQTADPLVQACGLELQIEPALNEIDFGKWTNLTFEQLSEDTLWREWNCFRARGRTPGGESMRGVQRRIVRGLERIAANHPDDEVAVFSHGDVIKAALCWHLGMSLNSIHTLKVEPGSVAVLDLIDGAAALRFLKGNDTLFENGMNTVARLFEDPDEWDSRWFYRPLQGALIPS